MAAVAVGHPCNNAARRFAFAGKPLRRTMPLQTAFARYG